MESRWWYKFRFPLLMVKAAIQNEESLIMDRTVTFIMQVRVSYFGKQNAQYSITGIPNIAVSRYDRLNGLLFLQLYTYMGRNVPPLIEREVSLVT